MVAHANDNDKAEFESFPDVETKYLDCACDFIEITKPKTKNNNIFIGSNF